ncbi:MAG: nucleotidyltransferase family protein [Anaerolineae bacterium]|nr:nucleotidyltransferase family protein [Anaerolineae bacterium]
MNRSSFRPEEQLLLQCVHTRTELVQIDALRELINSPLDWNYLLRIGRQHRLIPLLYWYLKNKFLEGVPVQPLSAMRIEFRDNTLRNLSMLHEIKSVTQILAQAGIPAVPFKGVVLALQAYHHTALRVCRDIDLIVPHQDIHQAKDLLLKSGYQFHSEYVGADRSALYQQGSNAFPLVNSANGLILELHWRLMPEVSIDSDYFWEKAAPQEYSGAKVLQFSPEDLILLLLIHGSKHLWSELIWAVDVDQMLRHTKDIQWDHLLKLAQNWKVGRFVKVGMLFCHTLLNSPVPEQIVKCCKKDRVAVALCDRVQANTFSSELGEFSRHWANYQMREGGRSKLQYLGAQLINWKPSSRDIAFLPLPKPLRFLYPVVRMVRVPIQYMGGLIKPRKKGEKIYHE